MRETYQKNHLCLCSAGKLRVYEQKTAGFLNAVAAQCSKLNLYAVWQGSHLSLRACFAR